jgi:cyclopropane fatty-acyl-phospholipid synthase-like methyltransferase
MVRYLNERARREGHANLFSILGTPDDPLLPEPVDRVLMVNTYHHVQGREAYFGGVAGSLPPGGRLVIVDFEMGELPKGPPDAMKIPPDQVREEMREAGWELVEEIHDALPYQYILVFRLPGDS